MPEKQKNRQVKRSYTDLNCLTATGVSKCEFWSEIGQYAHFLWERKELSDVQICVQGKVFYAHMLILGCRSQYFCNLFRGKDHNFEISMDEYQPEVFERVLEFMYTGEIEISLHDPHLPQIFDVAINLILTNLVDLIEDLIDTMMEENLWLALQLAEDHQITFLINKAWDMFRHQFLKRYREEGFMLWDVEHVRKALLDDSLNVNSELDVFRAALEWIHYNVQERIHCAPALLECVRFSIMSFEELHACSLEGAFLMEYNEIRDLLPYALWYQSCTDLNKLLLPQFPTYNNKPRHYTGEQISPYPHKKRVVYTQCA